MIDLLLMVTASVAPSHFLPQDPPERPEVQEMQRSGGDLPSERDLIEQEREETSSTRIPKEVKSAPSTVSVITSDEVERSGVRFLTDALRLAPGLEVQRLSSTESTVAVRGYNDDSSASQGILGLLDGRQVYNEFFGSVVWETIPISLEEIDQIEVIRGPGSFVHGPNAMHGLVNILTKSPLDYEGQDVVLSGRYGSYGSSVASFTQITRVKDAAIKTKVGWDDITEFDPRGENAKDKAFLEVRYETLLGDKDHRLDLTGGMNDQKANILVPTFGGVPPVVFSNDIQEGFLKANYSLGELKGQVSWSHLESRSVPDQIYAPFELTLDTADVDVQYSRRLLDVHFVTVGTGYRLAVFETEDQDIADGRHKTGLAWIFLQDEVELIEGTLWLTGGVRWDRHSTSGHNVSPRLAAVWKFADNQYLRASAGWGFRNPSLREIWFDMPVNLAGLPAPATVEGNKDLKAEQMRSFELSYNAELVKEFKTIFNVYYNLVDRLVEFQPTAFFAPGVPSVFTPLNRNKEEAYGFEVETKLLLTKEISAFGSYAFGIRRDRDTRDRNPAAPRHKANGGIRFTHPKGFSGMLWATFFDDVEFLDPAGPAPIGSVDDYTLLNGQVSYRFSLMETQGNVFLQAFNLLDHDHREHPEGDGYGLILMGGLEIKL